METIDLRRVTEIHFHRSLLQLCANRGTVRPCAFPHRYFTCVVCRIFYQFSLLLHG